MLFSVNLLKRHSFTISPPDAPDAFFWTIERPGAEPVPTAVDEWTEATDTAYRERRLAVRSHFYQVSPTVFPEVYVNTFGIGAPLAGLPVYAVLDLFVDIEHDRFWWWHGAALTASLLTALAALFVFLAARGFVEPVPAVLVALAFGLGSCAWSVSSQALWQHPASTFFLSLAAWLLLRAAASGRERRPLADAWCGAAFGMAVLCRPTSAVVVLCTGAYLLWVDRRRCAAFVLGGLPFLVCHDGIQLPLLRPPPRIRPERGGGRHCAIEDGLRRPVAELLVGEPARTVDQPGPRGIVWFSPVLVLGFVSAAAVWRDPRYRALIPLQLGNRAHDPGGGQVVRLVGRPDLGLPIHRRCGPVSRPADGSDCRPDRREPPLAGAVRRVLLAWSIAVQFVGAYSYSLMGWSDLWRDYDSPEPASLWRWDRPQIGYHLAHFSSERARKKQVMAIYLNHPGTDPQRAQSPLYRRGAITSDSGQTHVVAARPSGEQSDRLAAECGRATAGRLAVLRAGHE